MKNTGEEYELFAREVFQAILRLKGLKNIEVKTSQDIAGTTLDEEGKPIEHEIDVHWEFELDGIGYKTIIQAKDWVSRVKKGHMIEFDGIINDIPLSDGIFVSKSGFQTGAVSWAKAKGIEAAELRQPTEEELANRVQHIRINFNITSLKLIGISNVLLDQAWLASLTPEQLKILGEPCPVNPKMVTVEGEDGTVISDLVHFAIDSTQCSDKIGTVSYTKACNPSVFFIGFSQSLPKVKISQFTATVEVLHDNEMISIDAIMTQILRSVTGTDSYFISEVNGELEAFHARNLPDLKKARAKKAKPS
jgi:hypothetical protein